MRLYTYKQFRHRDISVEIQNSIAVIKQGNTSITLPYKDWGKFSDAVERFYTSETPEVDPTPVRLEESSSYRQAMRDSGHGGMLR